MTFGRNDFGSSNEFEYASVLRRAENAAAPDAMALMNFRRVSFTHGYYNDGLLCTKSPFQFG